MGYISEKDLHEASDEYVLEMSKDKQNWYVKHMGEQELERRRMIKLAEVASKHDVV